MKILLIILAASLTGCATIGTRPAERPEQKSEAVERPAQFYRGDLVQVTLSHETGQVISGYWSHLDKEWRYQVKFREWGGYSTAWMFEFELNPYGVR